MSTPYIFDYFDKNGLLAYIFDTVTGHNHDGSNSKKVANSTVSAGLQGTNGSTATIALAAVAATDIIVANVVSYATTAYVTKIDITAGTGFVVTLNQAPGSATVSYAVFKST